VGTGAVGQWPCDGERASDQTIRFLQLKVLFRWFHTRPGDAGHTAGFAKTATSSIASCTTTSGAMVTWPSALALVPVVARAFRIGSQDCRVTSVQAAQGQPTWGSRPKPGTSRTGFPPAWHPEPTPYTRCAAQHEPLTASSIAAGQSARRPGPRAALSPERRTVIGLTRVGQLARPRAGVTPSRLGRAPGRAAVVSRPARHQVKIAGSRRRRSA